MLSTLKVDQYREYETIVPAEQRRYAHNEREAGMGKKRPDATTSTEGPEYEHRQAIVKAAGPNEEAGATAGLLRSTGPKGARPCPRCEE